MKYSLTDYQGKELALTPEQAQKIAEVSGLIEVEVAGQTHYLNPKNIASIKPIPASEYEVSDSPRLARPDHRGEPSPALEKLRAKWGKDVPPSQQETA